MHYYACPYCAPCPEAHLIETVMEEIKCKYENEKDCTKKHKCKKVMQCKKCKEVFNTPAGFLRSQKRKIKDG